MIKITKRIDAHIDKLKKAPYTGTLKDASRRLTTLEQKQAKLHRLNKVLEYPIKDTGRHLLKHTKKHIEGCRQGTDLFRYSGLLMKHPELSNIACYYVHKLTLQGSKNKNDSGSHGGELWDIIFNYRRFPTKVLKCIENMLNVSLKRAYGMFNNAIVDSYTKELAYTFFTTGDYIGYTEKNILLQSIIESELYTNKELNTMLMYKSNYMSLIGILSENKLCEPKYNKYLPRLKGILTIKNYIILKKYIQEISFY